MPGSAACHRCGATLAAFATEGFCSACMLEAGLDHAIPSVDFEVSAPRRHFGDYELMEEIARGGMGVVFKARQISLRRTVALKMILTGRLASEVEVRRFRDEARAAAALHHAGIVAIHEVGEIDGQPFFSMDLVEGRNLAEAVREGPFAPARAAACVRTVAEAIHYAHEQGILHRDLKPSNVLLDGEDRPHVTDFGLAKRVECGRESRVESEGGPSGGSTQSSTQDPLGSLTVSGQVLGSPNFMPPEQATGKRGELTAASDVYSLGGLLYHLLTGRPPFLGDSVPATLRLVMETEPVPPRLLTPTVPRDLETICLKCLDKDPRRRYATAREVADELARLLCDEPIRARPVGQCEKFHRWTRRHPIIAALTGVIGVLLIAVAVISTVAATRLQRANNEGREKLREAYLSEARANRWSGRPGRRFDSLDAIGKAAKIRPGIDLRNEAIAAMALVDLRSVKTWDVRPGSFFDINNEYDRYMRGSTSGPVTLHRLEDDREVARHWGVPSLFQWASLSPSGKLFSVYSGTNAPKLEVFRWGNPSAVLTLTNFYVRSHHFSLNDEQVAIGGSTLGPKPKNTVIVVDVESGQTNLQFAAHTLPSVCFNPDGTKVAVFGVDSPRLEIRALPSGEPWRALDHSDGVYSVAWQANGSQIVTATWDGNACVWDLTKPKPASSRQRHGGVVTSAYLSSDGGLLASRGWNDQLRLWDARTGRDLLRQANSGLFPFSPDDRRLAVWSSPNRVDLCEVAHGAEVSVWQPGVDTRCSFSSDGHFLASTHKDGVRLWDRASNREIGLLPETNVNAVVFHPSGGAMFTTSQAGLRRWSFERSRAGATNVIEVTMHPLMCDGNGLKGLSVDRHGQRLAVLRANWLEVYDAESGRSLFPRSRQEHIPDSFNTTALSPEGEWVATYEWGGKSAHVWHLASNDRGRPLMPGASGVAFSPDGQWLITGDTSEYVFWETKTWKAVRHIPRPLNAGIHAAAVFSPDGGTFTLRLTERTIGLFDIKDDRRLATFESPGDARLGTCVFSPDGSLLTVPDLDSGGIVIWDLRAIRQQLAGMGLDWDTPPFTPAIPRQALEQWRINICNASFEPRDPRCTGRQIDLTPHYNATFRSINRFTGNADNDLSALPTGLQSFRDIDFDLRGVIHLSPRNDGSVVTGIQVKQSCRRLHFLHSALMLTSRKVGTGVTVGDYVIHWADGEMMRVPVKNYMNVADWWFSSPPPLDTNTTVVAWQGENLASARARCKIQLYKFCWENPRPEIPVTSIDFRSIDGNLLLIALTAE